MKRKKKNKKQEIDFFLLYKTIYTTTHDVALWRRQQKEIKNTSKM
jgi:hypothetical protein